MASQRDLEMKAKAYHNYQITTHLPAQNIRVYDEDFAKCKPICILCDVDVTLRITCGHGMAITNSKCDFQIVLFLRAPAERVGASVQMSTVSSITLDSD